MTISSSFLCAAAFLGSQSVSDPVWTFPALHSQVGTAGIAVLEQPGGSRVLITMDSTPYGGLGVADAWFTLKSTPLGLIGADVSRNEPGMLRMLAGRPLSAAQLHLVMLYATVAGREVRVVDPDGQSVLAAFPVAADAEWCALADLDQDGRDEVIVSGNGSTHAYDGSGAHRWTAGFEAREPVVGQMDADPALEIAGILLVADLGTLAVEWNFPQYLQYVAAADVDGDGMQELTGISAGGNAVCYDVDLQAAKWSVPAAAVTSLHAADLDRDGAIEVVLADASSPVVLAGATGTELFRIASPGGTVRRIASADLGTDGVEEILLCTSTFPGGQVGAHVADFATRTIVASTLGLVGPFVGCAFGDLDGDQAPELVSTCNATNLSSGQRVLAFRWPSLELMAVHDAFPFWSNSNGIDAVTLADLDGDGDDEVVTALDWDHRAKICYFDYAGGSFTRSPFMQSSPNQAWFRAVAAGDVDADGRVEIVAACGSESAAAARGSLFVYDALTGLEEWSTPYLTPWDRAFTDVRLAEMDGTPGLEICALLADESVRIYDGISKSLEDEIRGPFVAIALEERTASNPYLLAAGVDPVHPARIAVIGRSSGAYRILGAMPADRSTTVIAPGPLPATAWAGLPGGFELREAPSGALRLLGEGWGRDPWAFTHAPGNPRFLAVASDHLLVLHRLP